LSIVLYLLLPAPLLSYGVLVPALREHRHFLDPRIDYLVSGGLLLDREDATDRWE
jgi:hypothetical protein